MTIIKRVVKPTTHKGKKALLSREPKLIEEAKQAVFIRGKKTPETLMKCMKDLYSFKKPDAVMLGKKNDIIPFDNGAPIEEFSRKLNAPLFVFANSNKKRPNNIIFGRTFQHQLLDMIELGVESYKSMQEFACEKISSGIKPCILFAGEAFNSKPELIRLKNLLVDIFHREKVKSIRLQGLEHVVMFTAIEEKILLRSYRIILKKSGTNTPRVELEEIGPSIDFKLRRTKLASDDLFKIACKQPKELKVKKVKNVSKNVFGTTEARIHLGKQNLANLQVKKMKGLKRSRKENREDLKEDSNASVAKVATETEST